jgi:hypothetical protein
MKPVKMTSTGPGRRREADRLLEYARRMTAIGVMIDDLCVAIDDSGHAELYDDPQDPLGRAACLVDGLRTVVAEAHRFAEGERQATPPDLALALELREGADRLSGEIPKLIATLDHHLPIQARRLSGRQGHHPSSGR